MIDPASQPEAKTTRVAVVDDDASVRRAFARLLRASGFEPLGFACAEEFLEETSRVDCVVLDLQLGGMSGLDLQRELETRGSSVPIIFVTAHATFESRARAQQAGSAGFFEKPIAGDVLLAAVRRALAGAERERD